MCAPQNFNPLILNKPKFKTAELLLSNICSINRYHDNLMKL